MNNTNLTYHGKVDLIKVNKKGKILNKISLQNKGYETLFTIFAQALVGIYNNQYIPTSVALEYRVGDDTQIQFASSGISGLVYVADGDGILNPHVKLTAYIPYDPLMEDLKSQVNTDTDNRMFIVLKSKQKTLADLDISNSSVLEIQSGQSFILNWYLYIDNETEGVTSNNNQTNEVVQNEQEDEQTENQEVNE